MPPSTNRKREIVEEYNDEVQDKIQEIDLTLIAGLDDDGRMHSSVPDEMRGDDIDFIQMTGLTRPVEEKNIVSPEYVPDEITEEQPDHFVHATEDMDPSKPVSFYEEGVADVDHKLAPAALDEPEADSLELVAQEQDGEPELDSFRFEHYEEPAEPEDHHESDVSSSLVELKEIVASLSDEEDVESFPENMAIEAEGHIDETGSFEVVEETTDLSDVVEEQEPLVRVTEESILDIQEPDHLEIPEEEDVAEQGIISESVSTDDVLTPADAWFAKLSDKHQDQQEDSPAVEEEPFEITDDFIKEVTDDEHSEIQETDTEPELETEVTEEISSHETALSEEEDQEQLESDGSLEIEDIIGLLSSAEQVQTEEVSSPDFDVMESQEIEEPQVTEIAEEDELAFSIDELDALQDVSEALPDQAEDQAVQKPVDLPPQAASIEISPDGSQAETLLEIPLVTEKEHEDVSGVITEEKDSSVYRQPVSPNRRRRNAHRGSRTKRRLRRGFLYLSIALLLLVSGLTTYKILEQTQILPKLGVIPPEKLYEKGLKLEKRGEYQEAVNAYIGFAEYTSIENPNRSEALLAAARIAQRSQSDSSYMNLEKSLELLSKFMGDYPNHEKVVRAANLMGIINFRLGRYEEAITILRNPKLRIDDPTGALPALRTLAKCYGELGEIDAAKSNYLQAASIPGNYSSDFDYDELATLYHNISQKAEPEHRKKYHDEAIKLWGLAVKVPGIDPTQRNSYWRKRQKLIMFRSQISEGSLETTDLSNIMPVESVTEHELIVTEEKDDSIAPGIGIEPSREQVELQ